VLFAVVFIEKKAKYTKKLSAHKIFNLISPQQKHFMTKFQLILKATVQGYNFQFLTIFGNWSCDQHPDIPLDGP
jgi:hypothetical protein